MKYSLVRRLAVCALLFFAAGTLSAQTSLKTGFGKINADTLLKGIDASADIFEYAGDNMIARGHVVLCTPDIRLTADSAVVHLPTRDVEAFGNVSLVRRTSYTRNVDQEEYEELLDDVRKKVEVIGHMSMPSGRKKITLKITETTAYVQAERLAGNLNTGALKFQNFAMKSGALYAAASYARRKPSGEIVAENTRMTTCDYIMDDHDHYAITASKAYITPRHYRTGLQNYNADQSDHSVLLVNPLLRLWDLPVLWVPALYKPRETDSFGIDLTLGKNSDWGFWVRTSKNFELYDDPYVNAGVLFDFYSKRGFGGGLTTTVVTGNSRTEFFGYGLRDREPYQSRGVDDDDIENYKHRLGITIPKKRYDFKLTNVTHITPRLDFRGQVEFLSDPDFLDDYFESRYRENVQPPTYAALEYQADWASFSILATGKVNSFDSVVQRLPEARVDIPRQEIFGGLYYQGENSIGYLRNDWRDFNRGSYYDPVTFEDSRSSMYRKWRTGRRKILENYGSGRFDSLHMFYYPIMLDYVNIVPRAGVRLTAYTAYSRNDISDEELNVMFGANALDSGLTGRPSVTNFNVRNRARLRFMSEFGVEVNTKIYRTWQDVRSSWLGIDGLRHVMVPYINYTYIPKPTFDSENVLYFDDIDRLDEQNFIRFGLSNRLQTRDGYYGSERIREWASLETYWDFHAIRRNGFNNSGDLGIKLSLTPFEGFSLTSQFLFDIGGNNDLDSNVTRGLGRSAGKPGLLKWRALNEWNTSLNYQISKDWRVKASYIYSNRYWRRSVYSMGSMLDTVNATSSSLKVMKLPTQQFSFSLAFPTYIDPKLKGEVYMVYDVNEALMHDIGISLVRDFHCFKVGVTLGVETDRDSSGDKDHSFYVSGFVALSAMPSMKLGSRR